MDTTTWAALGRGLSEHPDDALLLMRAVRDEAGQVVDLLHEWVNATAERNAGTALQGRTLLEVYTAHDAFLLGDMTALLETRGSRQIQVEVPLDGDDERLRGRVFSLFMTAVGEDRLVCQYRDITDLHDSQRRLEHDAGHDALTDLPNRRLLRAQLDLAVARLDRGDRRLVVLMCDLDEFKVVNDTYGHAAGDDVLRQVGRRLRSVVRPEDLLARYGGDEFLVLCEDLSDVEVARVAERLCEALAEPFPVGDRLVRVGISIGTAVASRGMASDELLGEADQALYARKLARRVQDP